MRPLYAFVIALASALVPSATPAFAETVAAGSGHTIVVKPDGTVWTWGYNWYGQLGDGTWTQRSTPVLVPSLANIVAVAAGSNHTLALDRNGTVWAWGANSSGQLGDGSTTTRATPVIVGGLPNVIAIAAGTSHSAALGSDGSVWTWGSNANGQLGNGDLSVTRSTVPLLVSSGWTATAIASGHSHTLAVRSDGTLWAWGLNGNGQLGDGTTTQRSSPVQVTGIAGAVAAAGGNAHSLVVLGDGRVLSTGFNAYGQRGDGTTVSRTSMAVVSGVAGVVAVNAGYYFTSVRTAAGEVWSWGNGNSGQLGNGATANALVPVKASVNGPIVHLAAGHYHAVAATDDGIVYTWGANSNNQLGDGTNVNRLTPTAISDIDYEWRVATPQFSVAAGIYNTDKTIIITDATDGAEIHYTTSGSDPTLTDPIIASGGTITVDHLLTLKARAWKTGMPDSPVNGAFYDMRVGAVGASPAYWFTFSAPVTVTLSTSTPNAEIHYTTDGLTDPTTTSPLYTGPLTFSTTTTVKAAGFRTGWTATSVLTATYRMNFGTLAAPVMTPGEGTYTSAAVVTLSAFAGATIHYTTNGSTPTTSSTVYTAPLTVATTSTIKAIATHPDYTTSAVSSALYTIVVANPVFTPGGGSYPAGQTVTVTTDTPGATIRYTLDGRDPTDTDTVIISGSALVVGNYTLKARAWKTGCTTSAITTGVYQVSGQFTVAFADGGDDRSILVRPDGVVWTWGTQSGNGTYAGSLVPMQPAGLTGVKSASAGGGHILLSTADGSVYAWGWNSNGQLGDGTTTTRYAPVRLTTISGVANVSAGGDHSIAVKQDGTVWAWGINSKGQLGDNTTSQRNSPVAVPGLTGVSAVAAGEQFSIALKSDGTVWAWGDNAHGQLGDGTTTERHVPVRVTGLTNVVAIGAGYDYAVALLNNGNIRAWGNNGDGQLGDGSTTQRLTPVSATGLPSVSAIAVGHSHVLAIANNGDVWAWGNNINGQLGYPTGLYQSQATPAQVPGIADIVAVGAGMGHSLAIAEDGAVWAWGYNYYGQLGDGTTATRSAPVRIAGPCFVWKVWAPLISPVSGTYNAVQTATITDNDPAATLHYALTGAEPVATDPIIVSGGTIPIDQSLTLKVSAWKTGAPTSETTTAVYELKLLPPSIAPATGSYGGSTTVTLSTPVPGTTITYTLDGTEPTESSTVYSAPIVVGQTLTLKARVYKPGWTASDSGYASYWITEGTVAAPQFTPPAGTYGEPQLIRLTSTTDGATIRYTLDGTDPMETSPLYRFPFLVSVTTTVKARAFRTGMTRSAIATATYALDAAGSSATPTLLPAGGRFTVRQTISVQAPAGATVRYTVDGRDPADSDPLVGPERTIVVDRSLVLKVRAWASGLEPSAVRSGFFVVTGQVAAGYVHTIALTADGTVWSWGYNYFGTIGDGTTTNRLSPVQVGISDVQAVAGGYAHTLALKRDGTVWAWGLNDCGQLGDNTTTNHSTPVQVIGLTNVVAIAAGGERDVFSYSHSLALKADGTVWAWGCNQLGQLGDGTTTTRKTPVQVTGLGGVTAIAAGGRHSIAVEGAGAADGVIWTWGNNQYGTLGDGSTISRSVAVRLPVTDVIDLVASTSGALARLSDGTVWRWGVGVRLDGMPTTPTPLPFVQRASVIGAGNYHAFALDRDEIRWGWGGNSSGQLAVADYSVSSSAAFASNRVWEGSPGSLMLVGGRDHSVLLRVDGTVAATGNNQYGQLGNGTTTNAPQPVVVPGLSLADNAWLVSDGDNDGLTAWREWLAGTDPYNADTNRNGILDGIEESDTVSALNPDTDGDGLSNAAELLLGTDPYVADTDGDGVPDGVDAFPLDPTRSAMPPPNPLDTTPPVIILKEPTTARPVGGGGL